MNFKSIGLKAAIATAVVSSSAVAMSPAQAINLSGSVTVSGPTIFSNAGPTTKIDFLSQKVSLAFGDFSSLLNKAVTVNPLTLNPLTPTSGSTPAVNPFIDFGNFTKGGTTSNLSFVLNPSAFTTAVSGPFGFAQGSFDGFFKFGGNTVGTGSLLAFGGPGFGGSQITINATAVPTPALLPGLLALGAGVLRKRKAEATEEVKADA